MVGTTHAEIIRSLTLRLTKTQRLEPKISNFLVVAASCYGDVFQRQGQRVVRIEGKINRTKYREILDENLLQIAQDLG